MWKILNSVLKKTDESGRYRLSIDMLNTTINHGIDSFLYTEISKHIAKDIYPDIKRELLQDSEMKILLNEIRRELVCRFLSSKD